MPARDISAIAEDMIDTLLEEGFDSEESYGITENALSLYLAPMQERILGEVTAEAIRAAANEAANIIVTRISLQRAVSLVNRDTVNKVEVTEESRKPPPTRFERDPVI